MVLRDRGYLSLDKVRRHEANGLSQERQIRFFDYFMENLAKDHPNHSKLSREVRMDKGSVSKFLKRQISPSPAFIGLVSALDDRYALAFAAFREITDYFFVEPGDGNIVDLVVERLDRKRVQAVGDKLEEIKALMGSADDDDQRKNGEASSA